MNKKYDNLKIIELHSKGLTDKEISIVLNVNANRLAVKRKRLGLSPNKSKRELYTLTHREEEILVGTLLGDSTIRYVHNQCKYPNLTFSHGIKQKEYFDWLCFELDNLKASNSKYNTKYTRSNGEFVERLVFTGKNMPCLIKFQSEFYKNRTKIIPISFIADKFTELSLYCLFMDDGSYDIASNSFIINTQCFKRENLKEFVLFLYKKFGLVFTIKQDNCLYLRHESNDIMKKILSDNNKCISMCYKCGESCHKTPLNGGTPEMDNPVLNPQEIGENA